MERYGKFEQEPFTCEAFIDRNRKGEYLWFVKVREEGNPKVREYEISMISSYQDRDEEGNTTAMNVDPKDLANLQILQEKTQEILDGLAEAGREMAPSDAGGDTGKERVSSVDTPGRGSSTG